MLARISLVISNWTGRPVFCCTTIARVLVSGPVTTLRILILTRSQPRSLLSMARSKSARSRMRLSRSRKNRIAQICLWVSGRLVRHAFRHSKLHARGWHNQIENGPCEFSSALIGLGRNVEGPYRTGADSDLSAFSCSRVSSRHSAAELEAEYPLSPPAPERHAVPCRSGHPRRL